MNDKRARLAGERPGSLELGRSGPDRALRVAVLLIAAVGVTAAVLRGFFPGDFALRANPVRERLFHGLGVNDPHETQRPEELRRFDARFAENPRATLLHILPGGLFLLLAPLQFSSRFRNRHLRVHRWSGRLLVVTGFLSAVAGLYFGLLMPYAGPVEFAAVALFGGLFLYSLGRATLEIRRHRIALHREWMIRAFSIAVGIGTVRVVSAVFDLTLTPLGLQPAGLLALSLWSGWLLSLGAGELWIRRAHKLG